MAFVYRYVNESPPAPYVRVILARPDGTATTSDIPAKVDTGADWTIIPSGIAAALGLGEVDRRTFGGFGGAEVELPVYELTLVVRDLAPIPVRVAASDGEPHVLLGRDVLNFYKIVLDGPNQRLEIS